MGPLREGLLEEVTYTLRPGTSLGGPVVKTTTAGGTGLIPGQGTKISYAARHNQNKWTNKLRPKRWAEAVRWLRGTHRRQRDTSMWVLGHWKSCGTIKMLNTWKRPASQLPKEVLRVLIGKGQMLQNLRGILRILVFEWRAWGSHWMVFNREMAEWCFYFWTNLCLP